MAGCDEVIAGLHHEAVVVDIIQGGAGTSTNMNANEVIANLALRHLGHPPGAIGIFARTITSISLGPPMTCIQPRCDSPS